MLALGSLDYYRIFFFFFVVLGGIFMWSKMFIFDVLASVYVWGGTCLRCMVIIKIETFGVFYFEAMCVDVS